MHVNVSLFPLFLSLLGHLRATCYVLSITENRRIPLIQRISAQEVLCQAYPCDPMIIEVLTPCCQCVTKELRLFLVIVSRAFEVA